MLHPYRDAGGLSPLARGTPAQLHQPVLFIRFIPAGAGNTLQPWHLAFSPTVYPRWRGEHTFPMRAPLAYLGLSPLARGTHDRTVAIDVSARFIPAGAGNTSASSPKILVITVYPRWRGEHCGVDASERYHRGLSPLARGTPPRPF